MKSIHLNLASKLALSLAGLFANPCAVHAASYLKPEGTDREAAFSTASMWSPAIAPNNTDGSATAEGANTDYIVDNNRNLRPFESSLALTFGGKSLQLGAADYTSDGNFVQKGDRRFLTVNDLRLYRGLWRQGSNGWIGLAGTATVYSVSSRPYTFRFKKDYPNTFNLVFKGDASRAIRIETTATTPSPTAIYMQADQSQYSGSFTIASNVYLHAITQSTLPPASGNNSTSAMQFGKPLDTFNPSALTMETGSLLRYEVGNPRVFAASDNRGLTLAAAGGKAIYRMVNGFLHRFEWPIAGSGTFEVTGSGTFTLCSECAVTLSIADNTSKLALGSGASITAAGALELPDDAVVPVETATGDRVSVSNLSAVRPKFLIPVSDDGMASAQLRLTGGVAVSGEIGLGITKVPTVSMTTDIPVLIIDSSVVREFVPSDFNPHAVPGHQGPTSSGVKVQRDETTGDQIVSITVVPYVKSVVSKNATALFSDATHWSSGVTPAVNDGHTYVVWDAHVRLGTETYTTNDVPGMRTVLYSPNGVQHAAAIKHAAWVFDHLLALDHSMIQTAGYGGRGGLLQGIAGNVEVQTTDANAFSFNVGRSAGVLSATVTGTGLIRIQSTDESTEARSAEITGHNTGYTGRLSAYNDPNVVNNTFAFKIATEENLGGNPSTFAADALYVGYGCVFTPTAALTIDDVNRGVTFGSSTNVNSTIRTGVTFNVAAGCDLTVKSPVSFESGTFTKTGDGIFSWGGGGTSSNSGVTLSVREGAIRPQSFDAIGQMTVSFTSGAALAFDFPLSSGDSREAFGVDLRSAALITDGDKLKLVFKFNANAASGDVTSCNVPVATFASTAAAQSFVSSSIVAPHHGFGAKLSIMEQTLSGETVATVWAAVSKIGFKITLR